MRKCIVYLPLILFIIVSSYALVDNIDRAIVIADDRLSYDVMGVEDDDEYVLWYDSFENYSIGDFPDEGGWRLFEYGKGGSQQVVEGVIEGDGYYSRKSLQLGSSLSKSVVVESPEVVVPSTTYTVSVEITVKVLKSIDSVQPISIEIIDQDNDTLSLITIMQDTREVRVDGDMIGKWRVSKWIPIRETMIPEKETIETWIYGHIADTITKPIHLPVKIRIKILLPQTETIIRIDQVKITATNPLHIGFKKIEIPDLGDAINEVAWSPDGRYIAVGTRSGHKVIIFDRNGSKIAETKSISDIKSLSWSPDGKYIAVGSFSYVYLFDRNGREIWEKNTWTRKGRNLTGCGNVNNLVWSPDGKYIALGLEFSSIILFDRAGTRLWERGKPYKYCPGSLSWSPDGKFITAGTTDGKLFVYNIEGDKVLSLNLSGYVWSVSWRRDGRYIAVGTSFPSNIFVIEQNGTIVWQTSVPGPCIYKVSWNYNGEYVAVGTNDRFCVFKYDGVELWSSSIGNKMVDFEWCLKGDYIAVKTSVYTPLQRSPAMITIYNINGSLLWDTGWLVQDYPQSFSWNPSKPVLAIGTNHYLYTFNRNGDLLWKSSELGSAINKVIWDNSEKYLIVSSNGMIYLFDLKGNKLWNTDPSFILQPISSFHNDQYIVVINNTGRLVVFLNRSGVEVWSTGKLGSKFGTYVKDVLCSPDNKHIAIGFNYFDENYSWHFNLTIFGQNGARIWSLSDLGYLYSFSYSFNGEYIALGLGQYKNEWHGKLIVMNSNGSKQWEFNNIGEGIIGIYWSPNDKYIAVKTMNGYYDEVIVFTRDGDLLWAENFTEGISVSWSPDSKLLLIGLSAYNLSGDRVWRAWGDFFSPDPKGEYIAMGYSRCNTIDNKLKCHGSFILLDYNGTKLYESDINSYVTCISWNPSGEYIVLGTSNKLIIYDRGGRKLLELSSLGGPVKKIFWSPSGKYLVVYASSKLYVCKILTINCLAYFSVNKYDDRVFVFNASLSYVSNNSITKYGWCFSDGSKYFWVGTPVVSHKYSSYGLHRVALIIDTEYGVRDSISFIINVYQRPVPIFICNTSVVTPGVPISFNASNSFDEDGFIVDYKWSFSDGSSEEGDFVIHSFSSPGFYNVSLTVIDNDGLSNITWRIIEVTTQSVIILNSNVPNTRVYINGVFTGYTPIIRKLEPGKYTITLVAKGYYNKTLTLDLEANKTYTYTIYLIPVATKAQKIESTNTKTEPNIIGDFLSKNAIFILLIISLAIITTILLSRKTAREQ